MVVVCFVFWMFRLVVNPFVGVLVPARTKLIELGGKLPRQEWQKMYLCTGFRQDFYLVFKWIQSGYINY